MSGSSTTDGRSDSRIDDGDSADRRPTKMSRKQRSAALAAADSPARRARRLVWEHERQVRRKHTTILIYGLLAVVVVIGGLIALGVYEVRKSPSLSIPSSVSTRADGLVAGGSGPVAVDVYVDYECAGCRTFQSTAFATLTTMLAQNQITLIYHPVAMLDKLTTTRYSTRSAASAACAADMGKFLPYTQALFANQPSAHGAGIYDGQLIQLAARIGIIDPKFAQCVRAEKYKGWVARETSLAAGHPVAAAPSVLVDGIPIAASGKTPTAAQLQDAVAKALTTSQGSGKFGN
jgi:protein-disulfide isomerase